MEQLAGHFLILRCSFNLSCFKICKYGMIEV